MSKLSNFLVVNANNFDRVSLVNSLREAYSTQEIISTDASDVCLDYLHECKQTVVVLLDVEAPLAKKGPFGVALIKSISTDLNLGHVAVVSTSKTSNEQLMTSAIENGAVDHYVLPLSSATIKTLWLCTVKKQKIRSLESMRSSDRTEIVTNHTPINSWEYQNVIQLMNQYCSPLIDINLKAFPQLDRKDPKMIQLVQSWDFDAFALSEDGLFGAIMAIFEDMKIFGQFQLDMDCFSRFLLAVRANYRNNPYHNFRHAVDVLQSFYYLLYTSTVLGHLKDIEILGLAVASLCHDLAHPGLNNFYHVNARTPLALLYNNKSVLENFHATATFCILMRPEFNFISSFSQSDYKMFRDVVISSIMSTDMAVHFDFLNDMKRRYEEGKSFSLEVKDDVKMMATSLVKCSDISNVTRPYAISVKWAEVLMSEFKAQGKLEESSNLPVYPFGKADIVLAVSQKEFISFVAMPLFHLMAKLSDAFLPLLENLRKNLATWTEKCDPDRPPSVEAKPPSPNMVLKHKQTLANRRKSLPAAQFLLKNPHKQLQFKDIDESEESAEEKVESPRQRTAEPKPEKQKVHRRSTSESGSHLYAEEEGEDQKAKKEDSDSWHPPTERVSALKKLDGGTENIFTRRESVALDSPYRAESDDQSE